jgi:hypothetical protein
MIIAFYPGAGGNRYLRMLQKLEWNSLNRAYDKLVTDQEYKHRYLLDNVGNCDNQDFILTHCLNEAHIRSKFPNHEIVFIIGDLKKCLQREWALAGHERYIQKNTNTHHEYDRIEHYYAFKDKSWPMCLTVEDITNLPPSILTEVNQDFEKNQKKHKSDGPLMDLKNSIIDKVDSAYEIICWHKNYYEQYPMVVSNESNIIDIATNNDVFSKTMQQELELYNSEIFNEVWNTLNV